MDKDIGAKEQIVKILLSTYKVVNIGERADFEVQPGVYSSIYINLKAPLFSPQIRKKLAYFISEKIDSDVSYICGIESGASYYASAVADITAKKLILFRKNSKSYGIKHRFVGLLPKQKDKVVIVDDVISSGNTVADVVAEFVKIGCKIKVITLFSYGLEQKIAKNLGVEILALADVNELIRYGLLKQKLSKADVQNIKIFLKNEEKRLVKGKNE